MNINQDKTNGCDKASHIYGEMFNVLQDIMQNSGSYIQAEDCIADWLGLEMDYFDVLMYG